MEFGFKHAWTYAYMCFTQTRIKSDMQTTETQYTKNVSCNITKHWIFVSKSKLLVNSGCSDKQVKSVDLYNALHNMTLISKALRYDMLTRVTQFYLPPTHWIHKWNEPYLPSLPSCTASPHWGGYSLPIEAKTGTPANGHPYQLRLQND